jgi:16S rRNA (cytidine1402-2'-O)-methyltransferase
MEVSSHWIEHWIDRLRDGAKVALVSDAGTPVVSDPGAVLVARAAAAGIRVTPLPGPSAVITLLAASGFQETSFTFRGFFPRRRQDKVSELLLVSKSAQWVSSIWIWFESPQRIGEALQILSEQYPNVPTVVGKELTKVFERIFYGTSTSVAAQVQAELEKEGRVGEWCFSICFPKESESESEKEDGLSEAEALNSENADWMKAVKCLLLAGVSSSETARLVSQQYGISKKICYRSVILYSQYKKTEKGG